MTKDQILEAIEGMPDDAELLVLATFDQRKVCLATTGTGDLGTPLAHICITSLFDAVNGVAETLH